MTAALIYGVIWALLILPVARYARRNLREDRHYEGDELDRMSPRSAAVFGLLWAGLWPLFVIGFIIWAFICCLAIVVDSQMRM